MRRAHVIITVPHGKCPRGSVVRQCDERANEVALTLAAFLPEASVYWAPSYRVEGDLNRPETRQWGWRREIQAEVERQVAGGNRVVLFDIHSFPDTSTSFGVLPPSGAVPQLVILDQPSMPHTALARQITSTTSVSLLAVLVASEINDITTQARAAGNVDAMLWEFNESSTRITHDQIGEVARVFADYARAN